MRTGRSAARRAGRLALLAGGLAAGGLAAGRAVASQVAPAPPAAAAPPVAAPAAPKPPENGALSLSAVFAGEPKPIRSGLEWRVYQDRGVGEPMVLVTKAAVPAPSFSLAPGAYVVHAAFGFAGVSKRLQIGTGNLVERVTISAGALRLGGAIGGVPIPGPRLAFAVFVPIGNNPEGRLVLATAKAGELIRLPEGTYHVVSTYGESNAIARTDLKVETGRVTEAVLNHRAATLTLKLVAVAGGEAFAGTAFSVLTPGGDTIREAIGAFPSVTLAEGEYLLIARHEGQVHTREFKVESGLDRDIEVVAQR